MELGIFSKTFPRESLEETFDAVASHGLTCVQFNWETAGLSGMPDSIPDQLCERVSKAAAASGVSIAAVSGTFNIIHPDVAERRRGFQRLRQIIGSCQHLDTCVVTICTGTRNAEYLWGHHPDNDTPQAWDEAVASMVDAAGYAEEFGVDLALEPEVSNVVDSALKARQMIDEVGSPRLNVVMDGANIFHAGELPRMDEMLREAFVLLGSNTVLAHGKDLERDGEAGNLAAGTGALNYELYLSLLGEVDPNVPLILHGLTEEQVAQSVSFIRSHITKE